MVNTLTISKINESRLHLDAEVWLLQELDDAFKFQVPGFQYTPKFKNKIWDGYLHLISVYNQQTHVGLARQLKEFCEAHEYEFKVKETAFGLPIEKSDVTPQNLIDFVESMNIHSSGIPITFRDYQYDAIYHALKHYRRLILSPTGSGKSAQIYAIIRYLADQGKRILLLVPTVSLVTQMESDFKDYSTENKWNVDENAHIIYAGKDKTTRKPIVISTWQSVQSKSKVDDSWFESFDCVIVDEAHLGQSKEISSIVEKCINAKYKLGFTGTLDKAKTHKQMLVSLFGEVSKVTSTKALQDKGVLSKIKIKSLVLHYNQTICKSLMKAEYDKEMDFIIKNKKRNNFIRKLALSLTGNTLLLYTFVENHGKILNDIITASASERPVYFVHGGTSPKEREAIRKLTEEGENVIIIASAGTFALGVNIKRIHNIIFSSPTKSAVRVIQSIGRGLRVAKAKTHVTLYDLADDLRIGKHVNHTYKHFAERLEIYSGEEFEYNIINLDLE